MHVALMRGENLRLYAQLELKPHRRLNLIVGPNAAGKTTLLEGLYLLGRARSFRSADMGELAGNAGPAWNLFAEIGNDQGQADKAGAGWDGSGLQLRFNENRARTSTLAKALPLQLIDPIGHRLIEEGPGYRRSYIDWGVFHVEPSFFPAWQRYQRALRQRNQALRTQLSDAAIGAWDHELAESASWVTRTREDHTTALAAPLKEQVAQLLGVQDAAVEFHAGWNAQSDYRQVLKDNLAQHRRLATTAQGPHRAELKIRIGGERVKGRVSRGQQKLLVAALVLAQCAILIDAGIEPPVIMVDDFGAELSAQFQQRLADALMAYPGQVFISAFERPEAFGKADAAMFHVEHGTVVPV